MLNAALSAIFHADGSHNLRRQVARRIKALRLFLEMDALQVKRFDAFDGLVISFARHPAKSFMTAAIGKHHVVIFSSNASNKGNRGGKVFYFGRHGEGRIDQDRHCQLMPGAVVDHTALGGEWNLALLLVLRLLHKTAVAEDLQENQPSTDGYAPQQQHSSQQIKAGVLAEVG